MHISAKLVILKQ